MKNKDITIVSSEDGEWKGIYINGKLEYEGHSIEYFDILDALQISYTRKEVSNEWIDARGDLPENEKNCEFVK